MCSGESNKGAKTFPKFSSKRTIELASLKFSHCCTFKLREDFCVSSFSPYPDPVGQPQTSLVKNPPANAGDAGLIPGSRLGRSPQEGNGNPLQYSCLGNSMDRGAYGARAHGVTKEMDMT